MIQKTLKENGGELYLEFTDDELKALNLEVGQCLETKVENGNIVISKVEGESDLDIDLESFTKDELIAILQYMHTNEITFNEFVVTALTNFVDDYKHN